MAAIAPTRRLPKGSKSRRQTSGRRLMTSKSPLPRVKARRGTDRRVDREAPRAFIEREDTQPYAPGCLKGTDGSDRALEALRGILAPVLVVDIDN